MIIADIPKKSMPQGHSNFNDSLFDKGCFKLVKKSYLIKESTSFSCQLTGLIFKPSFTIHCISMRFKRDETGKSKKRIFSQSLMKTKYKSRESQ